MAIGAFQNLAETTRVVNMLQPKNINGAAQTSSAVGLSNFNHASIVIPIGVHSSATTITVEECTDATGAGPVAIPFDYYVSSATGSDVLGARQSATSSGVATDGATANINYVLEIPAVNLAEDHPYLRVKLSSPGANDVYAAVIGVLTTARYSGQPANMPSALV
jgi:hypothetical protein